jgi:hypothetical protein
LGAFGQKMPQKVPKMGKNEPKITFWSHESGLEDGLK